MEPHAVGTEHDQGGLASDALDLGLGLGPARLAGLGVARGVHAHPAHTGPRALAQPVGGVLARKRDDDVVDGLTDGVEGGDALEAHLRDAPGFLGVGLDGVKRALEVAERGEEHVGARRTLAEHSHGLGVERPVHGGEIDGHGQGGNLRAAARG